jgi:hypothetical protein
LRNIPEQYLEGQKSFWAMPTAQIGHVAAMLWLAQPLHQAEDRLADGVYMGMVCQVATSNADREQPKQISYTIESFALPAQRCNVAIIRMMLVSIASSSFRQLANVSTLAW